MKKILGLDLGLQSVGWAVLEMGADARNGRILGAGARVFPPAEVPKTMASPAKNRREKRGARRRLRRLRGRMAAIRRLMIENGVLGREYIQTDADGRELTDREGRPLIDNAKISRFHLKQNRANSPFQLRAEALERRLSPGEWTAVLTHLAKRRGFQSNRKNLKAADSESGVVLKSIEENATLLDKYKTAGQMLANDPKFSERKRNKGGAGEAKPQYYTRSVGRGDLRDEIKILFASQRDKGNEYADAEFEEEYLKIWECQRPVDSGKIAEMVGDCTFEPDEKRAPRMSYTAECFRVWQDMNHRLTIRREVCAAAQRGKERKISPEEKRMLFEQARSSSSGEITYADARKALALNDDGGGYKFKEVRYPSAEARLRDKIRRIKIVPARADGAKFSPPKPSISAKQRDEIWREARQNLKITYAEMRQILALDGAFCLQGTPKDKAFWEMANRQKLKNALSAECWNGIAGYEDILARLEDICMFAEGAAKAELLENIGADFVEPLQNLRLECEEEKEAVFTEMKGTAQIRKTTKKYLWARLLEYPACLDIIAGAVTYYKDGEQILKYLAPLRESPVGGIFAEIEDIALGLSFRGTAGLSLKAMHKILPYLEQGEVYSRACEKAGYDHSRPYAGRTKRKKLPVIVDAQKIRKGSNNEMRRRINAGEAVALDIRNPRVLRTLAQARKIVNAVVEKHGSPDAVHIELSRDVARSPKERREIEDGQKNFQREKELVAARIKELYPGHEPSGADILKMRLYQEQDGFCPYSGKKMEDARLWEVGYCEVDHILPLSRSMDDSQNNKVLCLTGENRAKGDRIPYEHLDGESDPQKWAVFCERVKHYRIGRRERLLKTSFNREEAQEHMKKWVDSPESKWIAREFANYVRNHFRFAGEDDGKQRVFTRNGTLTAFLRAKWGLAKDRAHHRHHALDAVVLAASTQGMVQRVAEWSEKREKGVWARRGEDRARITGEDGEVLNETGFSAAAAKKIYCPQPWDDFRKDALRRETEVFVSQPARRKLSGEAHNDTLVKMKFADKRGDSANVYLRNSGGRKHGIPGDKAQKESWPVLRTDVFRHDGKHYLSIVRPYHRIKGELPSVFVGGLTGANADNSEFMFSLYPGDAVLIRARIKTNKSVRTKFPNEDDNGKPAFYAGVREHDGLMDVVGYFRGTDKSSGRIKMEAHDKSWTDFRISVQRLSSMEKLEIPLLGDISIDDIILNKKHVVKKEKRYELAKPADRKPRRTKS